MEFSKAFVRFNWLTLFLIYLVIVAGSFVRISGSGMGCPDWPKCFGKWVPPTEITELPADYREAYLLKREKKVKKFCKFLISIGLEKTASKIENNPDVYVEEAFNVRKTWTEYINRLFGFLAGNAMLIGFIWFLVKYRKSKLVGLVFLNLILMGLEAWFGSIVVATNLVPWTITVHMFLALVIVLIQLYVLRKISPEQQKNLSVSKYTRILIWIIFAITFYQMFLGTQVREAIDLLVKQGFTREQWIQKLGLQFIIHRSFSWLVLVLLAYIAWKNEKTDKHFLIRFSIVVLIVELISGVLLAYAEMPGLVQTSHLIFASILFGVLWMFGLRMKVLLQLSKKD
jgi:cytochrome c oxidase assembly protein subunit 15